MTSKAGHTFTAGPAKYDPESGDVVMADEVGARIASVDIENCADVNQADADGLLIAEAFTIAHETGLTPRQLAERCEKLEAALTFAQTDPCFVLLGSVTKDEIAAAIAKTTDGGAV